MTLKHSLGAPSFSARIMEFIRDCVLRKEENTFTNWIKIGYIIVIYSKYPANHEWTMLESNMSMRQGSGISVSPGQPLLAEVQAKHLFVAYASNNKHNSCAVQLDLKC